MENDKCGNGSTESQTDKLADNSSLTSDQRLEIFLERVLGDVEAGRFPIRCPSSYCERFNTYALELNARHGAGDAEGIREIVGRINRVLILLDLP